MNFLFPTALWGLSLLSIPIIIHLFNFRRIQVIEFSTLQFISEVEKEVKRKKSLKHLLILFARLLFLFFLVMAFAQPTFESSSGFDSSSKTVIYLDNSYSMNANTNGNQSMLLRGINLVESFLVEYPIERELLLQSNEFANNFNRWNYKNQVQEQLTEIYFTGISRSFPEVQNRVNQIGKHRLLYISDFQKSTFGELVDTENEVVLVPIENASIGNIYIDSVYFQDPVLLFDRPNTLIVEVAYSGSIPSSNVNLKVFNDNRLLSSFAITFEQKDTKELEMEVDFRTLRSNYINMTLDDPGLSFDNEYFITINSLQPPVVKYVYQDDPNPYLEGVYGNTDLFDFEKVKFSEINYQEMEIADLVIIEGFDELPGAINEFLRNSDILLFSTSSPSTRSYSSFLGEQIENHPDSTLFDLRLSEEENPLFSNVFVDVNQVQDMPKSRLTLRADFGTPIVSTVFGTPFLTHKKIGEQNLYLCAAPLDLTYSSLPIHALFLPLMYRITQFSGQPPAPLAFDLDTRFITLATGKLPAGTSFRVLGENVEFVPNYNINGDQMVLELPPTRLEKGYYHVVTDQDTIQTFALNHSRLESEDNQYSIEELREMISGMSNYRVVDVDAFSVGSELNRASLGDRQLWKYALFLALFFLIAETLLVRFL